MEKMLRLLLLKLALLSSLVASALPDTSRPLPNGMDTITLKAMIAKKPSELSPEVAILVGNIFEHGMDDLNVNKNVDKAKLYYRSSADRGEAMGNLLLANLATSDNNVKVYVEEMEAIVRADDEKLSIPAGLQLSAFWISHNNKQRSIETLMYLANIYDEPRAQFLIGWSIVSNEYVPHDMGHNDGQMYLYQACHNPKITKEIKAQCDLYSNK